jgi:hypothetical protein
VADQSVGFNGEPDVVTFVNKAAALYTGGAGEAPKPPLTELEQAQEIVPRVLAALKSAAVSHYEVFGLTVKRYHVPLCRYNRRESDLSLV